MLKKSKLPFGNPDTDFLNKLSVKDSQIKESKTHVLLYFCLSAQDSFARKGSSSLTLAWGKARSLTYSLTGFHLMEKNSSKANVVFLRRQNTFVIFSIKFSEYQYFQDISEVTTLKI